MAMPDKHSQDQRLTTELPLLSGAIDPLLFVVVFLIGGATRSHYSAWYPGRNRKPQRLEAVAQ
jgi:hypothetical protein